jgi:hypothetical protein
MSDLAETIKQECLIQIRGIYDGWSVKKLADGTLINRWEPDDRRHKPTQDWIEKMQSTYKAVP